MSSPISLEVSRPASGRSVRASVKIDLTNSGRSIARKVSGRSHSSDPASVRGLATSGTASESASARYSSISATFRRAVESRAPNSSAISSPTDEIAIGFRSLANVAIGSASQEEYIDALRESVTDEDAHLQRYFGAVATVLDGIRTGDEESVEDGLVILLDRHAEKREGKSSSLRDHVSRRPLALFLLARKRGLNIDIDSQYIPDTVL